MASTNQTPNFGLSQWEPRDHFIRTDFNADNAKIDAALSENRTRTDTALEQIAPINWNLYHLFLREYYEGQYTGFKKAMIFDGFLDGAQIESMTPGTALCPKERCLFIDASGKMGANEDYGYNLTSQLNTGDTAAVQWTPSGLGVLASVEVYFKGNAKLTVTDSAGVMRGSATAENSSVSMDTRTFHLGVVLVYGETYTFRFEALSPVQLGRKTGSKKEFGFFCNITPYQKTQASVVSKVYSVNQRYHALTAWVRYTTAMAPGLSVLNESNGQWVSMTALGAKPSINLNGDACYERTYTLDTIPAGNLNLKLRFDFALIPDLNVKVYDYCVLFF